MTDTTVASGHDPDTGAVDAITDDRPVVLSRDGYEIDADGYLIDPTLVQTRAMDIVEMAVEVTAPPNADPVLRPRRRNIDIALQEQVNPHDLSTTMVSPGEFISAVAVGA